MSLRRSCSFFAKALKPFAHLCPRCGCTAIPLQSPAGSRFQLSQQRSSMDDAAGNNRRMSALDIQMLSKCLHRQIFGTEPKSSLAAIKRSQDHLKSQGLWGRPSAILPDVDVQLPPLLGSTIDEHFYTAAETQCKPYLELARKLAANQLPPMPKKWQFEPGWTRYDGKEAVKVDCPDDDALIFDVEVCVTESPRPILATAASDKYWYSWVSKRLVSGEDFYANMQRRTVLEDLIPLETREGSLDPISGSWQQRLVVGHSVSYDRARVKEQYLVKGPRIKFLDTLSLHTCVAGQTTAQKILWRQRKGWLKVESSREGSWMDVSSPNSLMEVHWLHVRSKNGGEMISKEKRDVFIKGTIQDIRKNFQSLMRYCADDVFYTHEVLQEVLPLFLKRCPHPVTLAGMLEMGGAYLPVDTSWEQYISDVEYTYEDMEGEMKSKLMALADSACPFMHNKRYEDNPWLCNLDWSSKKFRGKAMTKAKMKQLLQRIEEHYQKQGEIFRAGGEGEGDVGAEGEEEERVRFLISSEESTLPKRPVHMPGYPEWYRGLCMRRQADNWRPGCVNISAQMRVVPYLLRMKWEGNPLHHHPYLGWGYIVPMGNRTQWGDEEVDVGLQLPPNSDMGLLGNMMDAYELIGEGGLDSNSGVWLADAKLLDDPTVEGIEIKTPPGGLTQDVTVTTEFDDSEPPPDLGGKIRDQPQVKKKGKVADSAVKKQRRGKSRTSKRAEAAVGNGWEPVRVEVDGVGVSDDVVTLNNGEKYCFFKLPHKDGAEANCGNPLSKDYLHKMENRTLTSAAGHMGQRILTLNSMVSFWRSARNRILDQFVVWSEIPDKDSGSGVGAIIPIVTVAGTATRRAVEPTWLTASNAKENRVGSEQKAFVRAPPGYHIVGADVDSQELWIASVLGDMHFAGMHGCTAIGWMTLQGKKSDGTDVHSNTASTVGISRDHAKILNYGRIYGAGKPFIELLLKRFNPSLSEEEVREKASTLYAATKGTRMLQLSAEGKKVAKKYKVPFNSNTGAIEGKDWRALKNLLRFSEEDVKELNLLTGGRPWVGGSESHLFNKLEGIALSRHPHTPVLGCRISKALEKEHVGYDFVPSKVNWVVQSSAVDYLHLMLVCMRWLFDTYNIDGRFCISIHDEVRYLVKSEHRYRAALALQFTNLFTRAMFAHQLCMNDLPQSVAFFSAVDIDTVLRKEATMDCKTPSNPLGLEKGHGISYGEVLDIYQVLEKTDGSLLGFHD